MRDVEAGVVVASGLFYPVGPDTEQLAIRSFLINTIRGLFNEEMARLSTPSRTLVTQFFRQNVLFYAWGAGLPYRTVSRVVTFLHHLAVCLYGNRFDHQMGQRVILDSMRDPFVRAADVLLAAFREGSALAMGALPDGLPARNSARGGVLDMLQIDGAKVVGRRGCKLVARDVLMVWLLGVSARRPEDRPIYVHVDGHLQKKQLSVANVGGFRLAAVLDCEPSEVNGIFAEALTPAPRGQLSSLWPPGLLGVLYLNRNQAEYLSSGLRGDGPRECAIVARLRSRMVVFGEEAASRCLEFRMEITRALQLVWSRHVSQPRSRRASMPSSVGIGDGDNVKELTTAWVGPLVATWVCDWHQRLVTNLARQCGWAL